MAQKERRHFWRARCSIKVKNLAFKSNTGKKKKVGSKEYYEVAYGRWRKDDRIIFDPAYRLKGWLKQQILVAGSESAAESVRHGLFIKNLVNDKAIDGMIEIADIDELSGLTEETYPEDINTLMFDGKPLKDTTKKSRKFPIPFHEYIRGTKSGTSSNSWWFELNKELVFNVEITSFARRLQPNEVKEMLSIIGPQKGIGDRHSAGRNGCFELTNWELLEDKELELP